MQSQLKAQFLPFFLARSSYLMMTRTKDVRPASLALSGSEGT